MSKQVNYKGEGNQRMKNGKQLDEHNLIILEKKN